jgi:hypothetical protein
MEVSMQLRIKSQLPYVEKGGILDDCGPCSTAAAVSWALGYAQDFTGLDGIKAKEKATGYVDKQGVSDNGSNLSQLAKTAKVLGGEGRYAKNWDDVLSAGKKGAAIIINVQAPKGYPVQALSSWNKKWADYWGKKDPKVVREGYGHMTCAAYDKDLGWQFADPTFSGKGKEEFAALISEADLKAIASGKGDKAGPHVRCLIVTKK